MRLDKGDKLVMIGDSITDCERARPVGEGLFHALGKGYVSYVDGLLGSVYPELGVRVVNMGVSGNTVRDLKGRWQTDVLDLKPDWVSVMIGTNDVWRQFDLPAIKESHVYADEYEAALDELVARTKPEVKGIVLMTPFYLEPNRNDAMRAAMDRYGEIVKRTAERHGTLFVDTQAEFDRVMEHLYPATIAWDRVHPNAAGHMTLARAFLNAIGFEWQRGVPRM
ncbi:MAG: GDSL family lipase [Cohnella sp.]|uniref:SGNH/GDSL hydrolase family protein n=1 Tax=Cohnella sp. TaxID=1883426 RepID=UPI000E37F889|nr:SGNH/GDSL hydrolase family protein [Cohnella sp.]REK67091.1 MAG: GDSL family lipase [Cohnella sp.]